MPRFYCDLPLSSGHLVALPDAVARHAVGVLRLRAGEAVALFNGDGGEYHGVLENVGGKGASVRLASRHEPARESPLEVRLAQGISSGERMDYTLQKAVELGVAAIQPLTMRRSVVRLNEEKAIKRRAHWQGVVNAACEQCGRNLLPPVAEIHEFTAWVRGIAQETETLKLLLDPEGDLCLRDLPPPTSPILLLAGPEGGFDPAERKLARAAGFHGLRLGPRVLRTETAALAALAAMQAVWGDFR
ncbi:MAG: 16S rRNA (uracil(1498)-N(3))-methyltransferase [Pseudomonadota bacterium]|nr:16S rRNA (uracil(1498)-N(3))-methyltransferase [Pseudomonadota bacterium]MDP1902727.1 16S rRNA (uracil(1498)-N(3))-methyltransferase [Pseudomonadota bacterium]MDP2350961.1 16S rRNA (uracil(1498)-N(3))-methyltransferase [Pseudomonadota bacterium]